MEPAGTVTVSPGPEPPAPVRSALRMETRMSDTPVFRIRSLKSAGAAPGPGTSHSSANSEAPAAATAAGPSAPTRAALKGKSPVNRTPKSRTGASSSGMRTRPGPGITYCSLSNSERTASNISMVTVTSIRDSLAKTRSAAIPSTPAVGNSHDSLGAEPGHTARSSDVPHAITGAAKPAVCSTITASDRRPGNRSCRSNRRMRRAETLINSRSRAASAPNSLKTRRLTRASSVNGLSTYKVRTSPSLVEPPGRCQVPGKADGQR